MAMTLKSNPATNAAAHNDLIFVVDSTNKAELNYKYICDVYINAVRVARLKNNPNPNFSSYGVFNVNKVVQSYLDSTYFTAPAQFVDIAPVVVYQIKFSERYESGGSEVINDDVITDSTRSAWNIAFGLIENQSAISTLNSKFGFLTDRSRTQYYNVKATDNYFLTAFNVDYTLSGYRLTYYPQYNGGGVSTDEVVPVDALSAFILNTKNASYTVPVGTKSIKIELESNVDYYDPILFNLDACSQFERQHFVFMNRYGGYESVYFDKKSKTSITSEKKTMLGQGFKYNASTFKLDSKDSNGVFYEQIKTFGTKYNENVKVNSDWLTDADYVWLKSLLLSPVIYYEYTVPANIWGEAATTFFVPVQLSKSEYEVKKKINERLTQIELEFEIGFNNYTQFR